MIEFFIKRFVPNCDQVEDRRVRERYSLLAGALGVACNLLLFFVKLPIGMLMNSIAITSDAFNNLSDMGSSLIAIISAKMSNRRPDKEHPFGHGRIEYISSLIIAFIILLVGLELLKGSAGKILHPEPVQLNTAMLVILALSVLVKLWMFSYNRTIGKRIDSSVTRATASDSLNDAITTTAVTLATLADAFIAFPLDGIVGVVVSLLILYSGYGIAKDTIGLLLGHPPSPELVREITQMVMEGEGIVGVHDMIVHDYGPGRTMASVHAEVPDDSDICKVHEVIDATEQLIHRTLGVDIVIHADPISLNNERTNLIRDLVVETVQGVNPRFTIHDFRMTDGENRINLIFDMAVPVDMPPQERKDMVGRISQQLKQVDPRFCAVIHLDNAY